MNDTVHDLIIIGAGPSALAAAVYTTREDIETVLFEKAVVGGLAAITDQIDNYPGFPDGIPGMQLADQLQKQALRFGAKIEYGEVTAVRRDDESCVATVDGRDVRSRAILVATGSDYVKLGIPGEAEYYGRGVHYCATCDGAFYRERRLVVVGGGNSGVQEALFLTRFASHIDLIVRSTVKASEVLQHELQKFVDEGVITIHLNTIPDEVVADEMGKVVRADVTKNGEKATIDTDGVFVFIGLKPNTHFLAGSGVELDAQGLVKTDTHLQTSVKGVYASGDVRSGATMQIASAVGEGATAALAIREYLDSIQS